MKIKITKMFMSSAIITLVLSLGISLSASAKTTDVLVQGTDGKYYQYSYEDLKNSLMDDKVLFNEFRAKKVISYKDDKTGYVSFDYLKDIYLNITDKRTFNLNTTTESAPSESIVTVTDSVQTRIIGTDGKVADGQILTPTNTDDLEVTDIY